MNYDDSLIECNLQSLQATNCLICLDESETIDNNLKKGTDVFLTNCDCVYLVHTKCIDEWISVKGNEQVCINCNIDATLKPKLVGINSNNCSFIKIVFIVAGIVAITSFSILYKDELNGAK